MTAFEIITIFIGILTTLFTFAALILTFLTFLETRKRKKK